MLSPETRERNRKRSEEWRKANPDYARNYWLSTNGRKNLRKGRQKRHGDLVTRLLDTAKTRAKNSGIEFNISGSDIVVPATCPIYDIPLHPSPHRGRACANSPSLDRIGSNRGYVPGNVQVISHRANTHKSDATLEEIRKLAAWAEKHMKFPPEP
jgi:hypothetical protein